MLQCVAVRCKTLQLVAQTWCVSVRSECCSVLQCVEVRCSVLQWVCAFCSVLQCALVVADDTALLIAVSYLVFEFVWD